HHPDDLAIVLARLDHRLAASARRLAAEAAVKRAAARCAELDPAELEELPGGEVGRERLQQIAADEGQLEERAEARQLRRDRLQHALLPLGARHVALGPVQLVLPDPRV